MFILMADHRGLDRQMACHGKNEEMYSEGDGVGQKDQTGPTKSITGSRVPSLQVRLCGADTG